MNISDADIVLWEEFLLTEFDPYSQFILSVPLKTEFFLKLNQKLNLSVGAGLSLNFITRSNTPTTTSVTVGNADSGMYKDIFYSTSANQNNINFSYEFSTGANYKTKFALIDLSIFVNNSVGDYLTGEYEIYNLTQSSDKSGNYAVKNNFYGISLAVSPKKDG